MLTIKIIGLAGTDASGKDTIGEMLAEKYGWKFISITDYLRDELSRQGVELTRQNMRELSAIWRRQKGHSILIDMALQQYEPVKSNFKGLVITSLRHPAESGKVHELGGLVIWTDADPHVRYGRIIGRNRGSEDHVSFEEFMHEEELQAHHIGNDDSTLATAEVKQSADIFLENNTSNVNDLDAKAEKALLEAKYI